MNRIFRLLCWGMALLLPMASLAADGPALLSGNGVVKVNGRDVPQSSVAYSGDTIATAENATATLTTAGTVVGLTPNSSVIYKDHILQMVSGRVEVTTGKPGIEAHLDRLTITPATSEARFQMRETDQTLILAALHGALLVTDGERSMVLSEGEIMTQTPERAAVVAGYIFPGWMVLGAVGGAAGAAAAGIVVAGQKSTGQTSTSPSKP